jgi:membrane-associated phospholipid phosphatase
MSLNTDSPTGVRGRAPALKGDRCSFLIAATSGVVLLAIVYVATFKTGAGRHLDREVLRGFYGLAHPRMAQLVEPGAFAAAGLLVLLAARVIRGPRCAASVSIVLVGASLSTQLLKLGLAQPRSVGGLPEWSEIAPAAWPSGHATASMSLILCAVLATPARWRPLVGTLGAVLPLGVSLSMLARGFHFPSDMLAGYLIAGVWTLLVLAALGDGSSRSGHSTSVRPFKLKRVFVAPAFAVALATLSAVALVIRAPDEVSAHLTEHPAFVAGVTGLALFGLGLPAGLAAALNAEPARSARPAQGAGYSSPG